MDYTVNIGKYLVNTTEQTACIIKGVQNNVYICTSWQSTASLPEAMVKMLADNGYAVMVNANDVNTSTKYTIVDNPFSNGGSGNTYTITATAGANGIIEPATQTVQAGATGGVAIIPDAGYAISEVYIDGVLTATPDVYYFENVQANHTISATFISTAPAGAVNYTANFAVSPETDGWIRNQTGLMTSTGTAWQTDASSVTQYYRPFSLDVTKNFVLSWKAILAGSSASMHGIQLNLASTGASIQVGTMWNSPDQTAISVYCYNTSNSTVAVSGDSQFATVPCRIEGNWSGSNLNVDVYINNVLERSCTITNPTSHIDDRILFNTYSDKNYIEALVEPLTLVYTAV